MAICRSVDRSIELLWASPREILNVVQADEIGVDIITVTEAIRTKLNLLGKDLCEFSLETVLMIERGEWLSASGYALASVLASVGALAIGLGIMRVAQ